MGRAAGGSRAQGRAVNPLERELLRRVRREGFTVTALIPDPPADPLGWTYTVGLCLSHRPELVIADMPADQAVDYIGQVGDLVRDGLRLREGDQITMASDGTLWQVRQQNPRDFFYGVPMAFRLFGERHVIRALRLQPPPQLTYPQGVRWSGLRCECGCGDPLDLMRQRGSPVGTAYLCSRDDQAPRAGVLAPVAYPGSNPRR